MTRIIIPYTPRPVFQPLHDSTKRWSVVVAHRRAGKTVALINHSLRAALTCKRERPRFAYLAPNYNQVKDIAWGYVKHYASVLPGVNFNEAELRCDLPNGATLRLYGAENYDRLRGIYLDGAVCDEFADFPEPAWPTVLLPALADREGWGILCGTVKGRNQLFRLYDQASRHPDWYTTLLRASETGILPQPTLDQLREMMGEERYSQEMECNWDAAVQGAYYGRLMDDAAQTGRIGRVDYEPGTPVETWWDLGIGDTTAIWFVQRIGREVRVIDFYEMSGEGFPHYAKILQGKPYVYGRHIAPHDIAVRELSSGRSRLEIAESLGIKFDVAPRLPVDDGINAVRVMLPRCWFDAERCKGGLDAMRMYRKDYDEKLKVFRDRPLHDWSSHAADAFRTGCVMEDPRDITLPRIDMPGVGMFGSEHGWMN